MSIAVQQVIVVLLVIASVTWLVVRAVRNRKKLCGSCDYCNLPDLTKIKTKKR